MIKERKKKMYNPNGLKKEYYLESLDEWLTPAEMSRLPGCNVKVESLVGRIKNATDNPEFTTLDGCIFTPKKIGNGQNVKKAKEYREHNIIQIEFDKWVNFHKLFPVMKSNLKPLIMQSRPIK